MNGICAEKGVLPTGPTSPSGQKCPKSRTRSIFPPQRIAEEIFYELGIEIRHVMKLTLAIEEALTHDPMNVGIPLLKVASGADDAEGDTTKEKFHSSRWLPRSSR